MSEPFIGQIMPVGFNFAPRGWALCHGEILDISSNQALFSLLGTTFGGDGRVTFGLPDLRGRAMVGEGSGPGLSTISWGEKAGSENTTLTTNNLPSHNHTATLHGETALATSFNPDGRMLALTQGQANIYADTVAADDITMAASSVLVQNTGGGQSFDHRDPFLGLYICIATEGIFPSRN